MKGYIFALDGSRPGFNWLKLFTWLIIQVEIENSCLEFTITFKILVAVPLEYQNLWCYIFGISKSLVLCLQNY